jgi:hypothetical protein
MPEAAVQSTGLVRQARRRAGRLVRRLGYKRDGHRLVRTGAPLRTEVTGAVELFDDRQIIGFVVANAGDFPVKVSLYINTFEVASTWADENSDYASWGTVRGFRIALTDLWKYCKRNDQVTVRVNGKPLLIAGHGTYRRPPRNGERSIADLKQKFADGYLFGQGGGLQLSKKLDIEWQRAVLSLYARMSEVVKREHGYEPFAFYGSLLGLVREGGFIGHDLDFDAAYLSKHSHGPDVAAELRDIAFTLIEAGFVVEGMRTVIHVFDADNPDLRIDLFPTYFDEKDRFAVPFGIAGTTEVAKDTWTGLTEVQLAGHPMQLPANAELLAEHLYGSSWRTPIAGFSWRRSRVRRAEEGVMPGEYVEEIYWQNFYARTELTTGSPFFDAVSARPDIPTAVVDIGCGDGRDSWSFAGTGRVVTGLDRSEVGIRHATKKAEASGLSEQLSFVAADVSDGPALHAVLETARVRASGAPMLFYMRFFLHSIPADVQESLMTTLSEFARDGDMLAAEFRTNKDKANMKVYGKHYRRFQNAGVFSEALTDRFNFTILDEKEGTGLSPYKDEDPYLYRVVARRSTSNSPS